MFFFFCKPASVIHKEKSVLHVRAQSIKTGAFNIFSVFRSNPGPSVFILFCSVITSIYFDTQAIDSFCNYLDFKRNTKSGVLLIFLRAVYLAVIASWQTFVHNFSTLILSNQLLVFLVCRKMTSSWAGRREQGRNGGRARGREGLTLLLKR